MRLGQCRSRYERRGVAGALARIGRECCDEDEADDVAGLSRNVGDHRAAVGVTGRARWGRRSS
jgi:hypothetical protein